MKFQINDFEAPPGLDDEVLAGCELHKVIDSFCPEPGCPNGPPSAEQDAARAIWPLEEGDKKTPIFRTRSKIRCIL